MTRFQMYSILGSLAFVVSSLGFYTAKANESRNWGVDVGELPGATRIVTLPPREELVATYSCTPLFLGTFKATAYCPCSKCCGKWSRYKRCAWNNTPARGPIIAVDPRYIDLGSKVDVEGHGTKLAADTGKDIKGRRIDILFSTHAEAKKFGVQKLKIWAH